jgi:hypothetical protein
VSRIVPSLGKGEGKAKFSCSRKPETPFRQGKQLLFCMTDMAYMQKHMRKGI